MTKKDFIIYEVKVMKRCCRKYGVHPCAWIEQNAAIFRERVESREKRLESLSKD